MKNIAIITTCLNAGGAERIAGLLSKELSKKYNVYLFLLNTMNIVYEYEGTIVDVGQSGPFHEYYVKKYKQLYDIDIAISFLDVMNFANIRSRGKERVIISERVVQSLMVPQHTSVDEKIKRYYDYADEIVSCSEGVKFDLIQHYNVRNQITTIYNFINKDLICELSKSEFPEDIKEFLGESDFFLNVGRLQEQKNQRRLILQFKIFHQTDHKNIKLIILGSGKLLNDLTEYIRELNMEDSIRIIKYTKNPFVFMAHAHSLIVSSHCEGLPNVVLEAMLLGCPVVSTDCMAGPRELLLDETDYKKKLKKIEIGKKGIVVCDDASENNGTTHYLADAMKIISINEKIRNDISINGAEYMESYHNEALLNKWINIIEKGDKKVCDVLSKEKAQLKTAKHIVIYGAGLVGRNVYIRFADIYKIDCFVVSKLENNNRTLFGIEVLEISELPWEKENTVVMIGVGEFYQDEVLHLLCKEGFKHVVYPDLEPLPTEESTLC